MIETIEFKLNGREVRLEVEGERKLLWVLRTELGLTGTKYGCGKALCGACTVLIDGKASRSCRTAVKSVRGREVITIEGLGREGRLHPLQKAFAEHGALQCGFCTPGMILGAASLLSEKPEPTEAEVAEGLEGYLCRCGTHRRILRAVLSAAQDMRGGKR